MYYLYLVHFCLSDDFYIYYSKLNNERKVREKLGQNSKNGKAGKVYDLIRQNRVYTMGVCSAAAGPWWDPKKLKIKCETLKEIKQLVILYKKYTEDAHEISRKLEDNYDYWRPKLNTSGTGGLWITD